MTSCKQICFLRYASFFSLDNLLCDLMSKKIGNLCYMLFMCCLVTSSYTFQGHALVQILQNIACFIITLKSYILTSIITYPLAVMHLISSWNITLFNHYPAKKIVIGRNMNRIASIILHGQTPLSQRGIIICSCYKYPAWKGLILFTGLTGSDL